ncbi:predicted protein [Streptomyces filamentosus NRRL 15998]|nr:predicted protein [Streptomyces filamentosus NRRL 15998]
MAAHRAELKDAVLKFLGLASKVARRRRCTGSSGTGHPSGVRDAAPCRARCGIPLRARWTKRTASCGTCLRPSRGWRVRSVLSGCGGGPERSGTHMRPPGEGDDRMGYRWATGGRVLRRRSFRVLSVLAVLLFTGGAVFPAWAALSGEDSGAMFGAAMCLGLGSLALRVTRSRVHLTGTSLLVVNPVMMYELPYGAVKKAEVNSGGSLVIVPRNPGPGTDEEGYLVVGFAGSLLDRVFRTSPKAAAEINKVRRSRRKTAARGGETIRSLTADPVADLLLVAAAACAVVAVFLRW